MTQNLQDSGEDKNESLPDTVDRVLNNIETYLQDSIKDINKIKKYFVKNEQEQLDSTIASLNLNKGGISSLRHNLQQKLDEGDERAIKEAEALRKDIIEST